MHTRRSREFWVQSNAAYERSGLTTAAFCERAGLELGTFRWWRWQLRRDGKGAVVMLPVEVTDARAATPTGSVTIAVGDIEIRFGDGVDVAAIADLVHALRRSC